MPRLHPYMVLRGPGLCLVEMSSDQWEDDSTGCGETINFPHTTISGPADWLAGVLNKGYIVLLFTPLPPSDTHEVFSGMVFVLYRATAHTLGSTPL
jgi:hypothetical protein